MLPGEDYFLQTSAPPVCHFPLKIDTNTHIGIHRAYWGSIASESNPFGFILKHLAGLHDAVICVHDLKKQTNK